MAWPPGSDIARKTVPREHVCASETIERADWRDAYQAADPDTAEAFGIRLHRVEDADLLLMTAVDLLMFNRVTGLGRGARGAARRPPLHGVPARQAGRDRGNLHGGSVGGIRICCRPAGSARERHPGGTDRRPHPRRSRLGLQVDLDGDGGGDAGEAELLVPEGKEVGVRGGLSEAELPGVDRILRLIAVSLLAAFALPGLALGKDGPPGPDGLPVAAAKHPWHFFRSEPHVDTLFFELRE